MSSKQRRPSIPAEPASKSNEAEDTEASDHASRDYRAWRQANVYDAVAGRLTTTRPAKAAVRDQELAETNDDAPRLRKATVHSSVLAPEEALFRRGLAPERYAEHDVYMSHERHLPDAARGALPDSDLLKAVHSYAGHFYSVRGHSAAPAPHVGHRAIDETSMDETALLALGILLEEAGRKLVGKRGDMVFTEGLEVRVNTRLDQAQRDQPPPSTVTFQTLGSSRQRKRRKVTDFDDD
ncbi:hypothetical protein ACHAQA_001958 [Verticillium albo-atrum]